MNSAGWKRREHDESYGLGEFSKETEEVASPAPDSNQIFARVPVSAESLVPASFPKETSFRTETSPAHGAMVANSPREEVGSPSLRLLYSPALVPILVALTVIGYGAFTMLWWERDRPQFTLSLASTPASTQSFRPTTSGVSLQARPQPQPLPLPQPQRESPATVPAPSVALNAAAPVAPSSDRPAAPSRDLIVPAVARAETVPRHAEPAASPAISRNDRSLLPTVLPDARDAAASLPLPLPPPVALPPPAASVAAAAPAAEAAVAASRAPEPRVVERVVTDRDAIGDVLQSYRAAYNSLDATSASTIWQGLDTRALQRAFSTLSRQDVSFDRCEVRVTTADRASALCRGLLVYVPKIGDGNPQERRLSWNFDFQRAADRWMIAAVTAR